MANSWSASDSVDVIVPENRARRGLVIDSHKRSIDAAYLLSNGIPASEEDLELGPGKDHITIMGRQAGYEVRAVTAAGGSAVGGYQEIF